MATHEQLCSEAEGSVQHQREGLYQIESLVKELRLAHAGELERARESANTIPYQMVQAGFEHLYIGGEYENLHIVGPKADVFKTGDRLKVTHCKVEGQRKATMEEHRARGGTGEPPHPDIIHARSERNILIEVNGLDTRVDNWEQPMMFNSQAGISGEIVGWRSITKAALNGGDAHSHINSRCDDLAFREGYLLGGGIDFGFDDGRQNSTLLQDSELLVFENYGFQWLTISNGDLARLARFCRFINCWSLGRFPRSSPQQGKKKFGHVVPQGVTHVSEIPQEWREDVTAGEMEL